MDTLTVTAQCIVPIDVLEKIKMMERTETPGKDVGAALATVLGISRENVHLFFSAAPEDDASEQNS